MLHELQKSLSSILQHQFCSLSDIQKWSDLSPGQSLFEYIYVFENYPIQDSLSNNDGKLRISDVRSIQETNYPLGVVILPGEELCVMFLHDRARYSASAITRYSRTSLISWSRCRGCRGMRVSAICACCRNRNMWRLWSRECFGAAVSPGGFAGGIVLASSYGVSGWRLRWRMAGSG